MGKKFQFKTISLGSEPEIPSVDELASIIAKYKGSDADLITFQMICSCNYQQEADINEQGVGGKFSTPRIQNALSWDADSGAITDISMLVQDYSGLIRKGSILRSIHESPGKFDNSPPTDDEDSFSEYCRAYSKILRSLRDIGIYGHVILTKNPVQIELELLSDTKSLIHVQEPNPEQLEELLEYTSKLIIPGDYFVVIPDLMERYDIRDLILVNPEKQGLINSLEYFDPEKIQIAGYAKGDEGSFWKQLKDSSFITV